MYELIESQVDSSLPMPKVSAIHAEDMDQAKIIEEFLKNEMKTLRFKAINDAQERTTPVQGGDFVLVEWDNSKGYHCTLGDLSVSEVHPRQVIPQPGMTEIGKMDYIFIRTRNMSNKDMAWTCQTKRRQMRNCAKASARMTLSRS